MRSINTDIRNKIRVLLQKNNTERDIARITGTSKGTVSRLRKEYNIKSSNSRGPKRALSKYDDRSIGRSFKSGEYTNAKHATRNLRASGIQVSPDTVRKSLHRQGFSAHKMKEKLELTDYDKKARLKWARKYRNWTVEDWKNVIFSDEAGFHRLGPNGIKWTWYPDIEGPREHNFRKIPRRSGRGFSVWGCITYYGRGRLAFIRGSFNSDKYCEILGKEYHDTLREHNLRRRDIVFQQDNSSVHTSATTSEWLGNHRVNVFEWPAYSPDLNLIENVWSILKDKLDDATKNSKPTDDIWQRLEHIWYTEINAELCRKLYESMPHRIEAVIAAKGDRTKW